MFELLLKPFFLNLTFFLIFIPLFHTFKLYLLHFLISSEIDKLMEHFISYDLYLEYSFKIFSFIN